MEEEFIIEGRDYHTDFGGNQNGLIWSATYSILDEVFAAKFEKTDCEKSSLVGT